MLNNLLKKIQEKYASSPLYNKDGLLAPKEEKEQIKPIKLPIFKILFSPFNQILDNGKIFFLLTLPTALLTCIFASLMGFNYLCTYSVGNSEQLYCSNSLWGYLLYSFIKVLIWAYVVIKWYNYVWLKQKVDIKSLLQVDTSYLKLTLYLFIFLLLNMLPLLSWWILYIRNPNPNWQIEMIFFAFVSIGFVMPIILLRFYTVLVFISRKEQMPKLSTIWAKTSGNTIRIFMSFFLILTLGIFIFGNLYSNFKALSTHITLYNQFLAEYIYDFFAIFLFISVFNNLNYQYEVLYPQEKEEDDE